MLFDKVRLIYQDNVLTYDLRHPDLAVRRWWPGSATSPPCC